jgi:geranylgeranyl pyrophosphate synthase
MALLAASLMMAVAILPCSHAGEQAMLRRMGVKYGVAYCIADDGCGHSAVLPRW